MTSCTCGAYQRGSTHDLSCAIGPHETAFPFADARGLTKRELIAAMALQGFIQRGYTDAGAAVCAVTQADALIRALNSESIRG